MAVARAATDDAVSNGDNSSDFVALSEPIQKMAGRRAVIEMLEFCLGTTAPIDAKKTPFLAADPIERTAHITLVKFGNIKCRELQRRRARIERQDKPSVHIASFTGLPTATADQSHSSAASFDFDQEATGLHPDSRAMDHCVVSNLVNALAPKPEPSPMKPFKYLLAVTLISAAFAGPAMAQTDAHHTDAASSAPADPAAATPADPAAPATTATACPDMMAMMAMMQGMSATSQNMQLMDMMKTMQAMQEMQMKLMQEMQSQMPKGDPNAPAPEVK